MSVLRRQRSPWRSRRASFRADPAVYLRWRLAHLADKIPGQCWSSLVDWVLHDRKDDPYEGIRDRLPVRSAGLCKLDALKPYGCYCGRYPGTDEREHSDVQVDRHGRRVHP